MGKRLNITVSFSGYEEGYDYIKSQPNGSYYIRKLVEEDIKKNKKQTDNININNGNIDFNNAIKNMLDL